jgi:hypothetical protein
MLNADSENDYLKTIASQEGYCPDDLLKAVIKTTVSNSQFIVYFY